MTCGAILRRSRILVRLITDGRELDLSSRRVRRRSLSLGSLRVRTAVLGLSSRGSSRLSLSLALGLFGGLALRFILLLTRLPLLSDLLEFYVGKVSNFQSQNVKWFKAS